MEQIERLFTFIIINWRGEPLHGYHTIVQPIAGTKTEIGLQVRAELDERKYPNGVKVSDAQLAAVNISRHASTVSGIIQPRQRARIFLAKKVMDSHNPPLTRRSVMSDGFLR